MTYRVGEPLLAWKISGLPQSLLFHAVLVAVRLVDWLAFGLRVVGRETLRRVPRAVLVSNHTLLLDPGVVAHAIRPRRTYFTMLEETALIPYLGTFVRLLGAIPIPQARSSVHELEEAARAAVEDVGYVHVFPEGECYLWSQEIRPFHRGAFVLARRLGLPILPLTTVLHERVALGRLLSALCGRAFRLPPRVTVVIGDPVDPEGPEGRLAPARAPEPPRHAHPWGSAALATLDRPFRISAPPSRQVAERVRAAMQATIERSGGATSIFRGQMPRVARARPIG